MHAGTSLTSPHGLITAEVLIAGAAQPLYRRVDGRHFTAGIPGQPYAIRARNLTGSRVELVVTVDGRHVLDDEPGDPFRCRGLVIGADGEYLFKGWRITDDRTGEFTFGSPDASVAARSTGSTANVGVIGIAVHREGRPVSYAAAAAPSYESRGFEATTRGGLGTGMGAVRHDPVGRTDFTRDGAQPDITVIGYDTEEALREMGLFRPADPDPFPATGTTGYARYAAGQ